MNNIDLNKYKDFVQAVTSDESNNVVSFGRRVSELSETTDVNVSLLLTAAIGLAAEGGEFCEIPKKVLFQGKPLDEDTIFHMKRELGDVIFYWMNACRALGLDPNDVIQENYNKLSKRYPDGFSIERSENRDATDI